MGTVLDVSDIYKEFLISKRQQRILGTKKRKIVAVNGISFGLHEGEIFCLLGTNGAGKTTTLRMLAGLLKPQRGEIHFGNKTYLHDEDEIKQHLGFLTSDLKLDGAFTPNYLFDFFGHLYHMDAESIAKRKKDLFSRFGIDRFAEVKIKNLSTGMKQKVSIAVSLVHDPDIIIFDEPTNGLDIITSREIVDFLKELRNEGKSIIISTHIFEIVDKLADRIGIIVDGKMACVDTYEALTHGSKIEDAFYEKYRQWSTQNE